MQALGVSNGVQQHADPAKAPGLGRRTSKRRHATGWRSGRDTPLTRRLAKSETSVRIWHTSSGVRTIKRALAHPVSKGRVQCFCCSLPHSRTPVWKSSTVASLRNSNGSWPLRFASLTFLRMGELDWQALWMFVNGQVSGPNARPSLSWTFQFHQTFVCSGGTLAEGLPQVC